jgi:hypothetical protein
MSECLTQTLHVNLLSKVSAVNLFSFVNSCTNLQQFTDFLSRNFFYFSFSFWHLE